MDPMVEIAEAITGLAVNPSLGLVQRIMDMHMVAVEALGSSAAGGAEHTRLMNHLHAFLERGDVRAVLERSVDQRTEAEAGDWLPVGPSSPTGRQEKKLGRARRLSLRAQKALSRGGSRRGSTGTMGSESPRAAAAAARGEAWTGIPYARRMGESYTGKRGQAKSVRVAEQGSLVDKRWACSFCTLVNRPQHTQCSACGSSKNQEAFRSLADALTRSPSAQSLQKARARAAAALRPAPFAARDGVFVSAGLHPPPPPRKLAGATPEQRAAVEELAMERFPGAPPLPPPAVAEETEGATERKMSCGGGDGGGGGDTQIVIPSGDTTISSASDGDDNGVDGDEDTTPAATEDGDGGSGE